MSGSEMDLGDDEAPKDYGGEGQGFPHDLTAAIAYEEWLMDPCGRKDLVLEGLERFNTRLEAREGLSIKGVDFTDSTPSLRAAALLNLDAALKSDADFPAQITGYYEGHIEEELRHTIEIYGEGPPPEKRPEPPKPAWL